MHPTPTTDTDDDPDGLLDARQAAEILGISLSAVRAYASRSQMPTGRKIGSKRHWTRREIEYHCDHPPSENSARLGRPPGAKDSKPRRPTLAAQRAEEIAARLRDGDTVTSGQLMETYRVTERTAQRLLDRARTFRSYELVTRSC